MPKKLIARAADIVWSLWLTACVAAACTPPSASPTVPSTSLSTSTALPAVQPRAVVIDTDMAADDWMAILYLLQRPDVVVKAITVTGAGEAHCGPGTRHALDLVALAGGDHVPVACGRETPLQGSHTFPTSWRRSVDNLLGLKLPKTTDTASNQTAVELLTSVIRSSPQKVTLLTLGPLTNVAEALQDTPAIVDNLEMIYIMGGAVHVSGNVGVVGAGASNDTAEWNIYVDPHAANVVLESGAPITFVPLDATNNVPVTTSFYKRLQANHTSVEATFVFEVLTKSHSFIVFGGYYFWDALAAAILTDESLATFDTIQLAVVEEEGPNSGQTQPTAGGSKVRMAVSADGPRFEHLFLDTLNAQLP